MKFNKMALVAASLAAMRSFGVAYVTNDTYTVTSYAAVSDRQQLNMYGGEIAFNNTGSYGFVRNVIRIDSPTDVTFVTTNSATPRSGKCTRYRSSSANCRARSATRF